MSFSLTTPQFKDRTKDVTRRLGWWDLKPGDRIMAVEKCQGLKKGEKIKRLGEIEIVSVRREKLRDINQVECKREGFPHFTPYDFIMMFMGANRCLDDIEVNRIQYRYIDGE